MSDTGIEKPSITCAPTVLSSSMEILRKGDLRQLGKELTSRFLRYDENGIEDALSLLERLLYTAEEPRLEAAHRAAVCDTLCGFLEKGSVSQVDALRSMCLNASLLRRAMNMYLLRSGDAQAKPMRQVLTVLMKLLSTNPDDEVTMLLINEITYRCLTLIYSHEDVSCIRAAMNTLGMFLSKSMLTAFLLIGMASNISKGNPPDGLPGSQTQSSTLPVEPELYMVRDLPNFVAVLMGWLREVDVAPAAGHVVVSLFKALKDGKGSADSSPSSSSTVPLWLVPIIQAVREQPELVDSLEHHVLPGLLRLDSTSIDHVVSALPVRKIVEARIGSASEADIRLCLIVCKVADDLGIPVSFGDPVSVNAKFADSSFSQCISHKLLLHVSSSVRIAALRLFIDSASSIKPLTRDVLLALQQQLPHFHGETDSRARNEFVSVIKKLFSRLQGIIPRLIRVESVFPIPSKTSIAHFYTKSSGPLDDHFKFLTWYISFLLGELQPVASYQRHISALKVMQQLSNSGLHKYLQHSRAIFAASSGGEEAQYSFHDSSLFRLLLDLIIDPFDDVRSAAAALVQAFPKRMRCDLGSANSDMLSEAHEGHRQERSTISLTLQRAEALMRRTGRADCADGVGRLYDVLYGIQNLAMAPADCHRKRGDTLKILIANLESDVKVAQSNLQQAILSAPLHGHLIALRYIIIHPDFYNELASFGEVGLRQWREVHDRLFQACSKVWDAVKEVLCFDSPEGHVIIDLDDDEPDVGVKDTLSYCWRALKEASSLMQAMITNPGYAPSESTGDGLRDGDFKALGDLAFTQLAELRHRGAFSTVSQTFAACCVRCAGSKVNTVGELPSIWYQQTLACIQEKAAALTRRSAGLPAMVTGILSAYPNGDFFDQVILELQTAANAPLEVARDLTKIRLPQVHALNCLKDVFTNTRLGPATEVHVETTLTIAVDCLEEDVWAIRNCGLMLLKALLTRLAGGTSSDPRKDSGRIRRISKLTYDRYPVLADLVLRLLQLSNEWHVDRNAARTQASDSPTSKSVETIFPALEIIERVGVAEKHRDFVKSLLLKQLDNPVWNLRDKAAKILRSMTGEKEHLDEISSFLKLQRLSQNGLHGRLLCLKYLVCSNNRQSPAPLDARVTLLLDLFDQLVTSNPCSITAATYLDVVSHIGQLHLIDIYKTFASGWDPYIDTPSARYVSAITEKVNAKWKEIAPMSSSESSESGLYVLDPLVKALASLKVLLGLLNIKHTGGTLGDQVLDELREGGEVALTAGLQTVDNMLEIIPSLKVTPLERYSSVLLYACGSDSKALAMETWTKMLAFEALSISTADSVRRLGKLPWRLHGSSVELMEHDDPVIQNAVLKLRGALMTYEYRLNDASDPLSTCEINVWCRMLKVAGDERSDLSTRLAVVASLECFKTGLRPYDSKASTDPRLLRIYLAIYDTLLDDDNDIRSKGAALVSWIVSAPMVPEVDHPIVGDVSLSPPAAVARLLRFMCASYGDSAVLFAECISRLTGMKLEEGAEDDFSLSIIPVKDLLTAARKEDSSLFVEEKQNLYIDPVQEASRWAAAIHLLSPSAFHPYLASQLEEWALEGLKHLTDVAHGEIDGPLSWTSKPEVFVLGMRILEAVKVVKIWGEKGMMERSIEDLDLLLAEWRVVDVHPLWVRKLRGV